MKATDRRARAASVAAMSSPSSTVQFDAASMTATRTTSDIASSNSAADPHVDTADVGADGARLAQSGS